MSVSCVLIKTALLHERLATHCTREAAALLTVLVVLHVIQQTFSRLEGRSAFCTLISLLVYVDPDVLPQAVTVLEGRAAQVARQAGRGFNIQN